MNTDDLAFLTLKVIRTGAGGKRTFEPDGKRRLIQARLQRSVSIFGLTLKAVLSH